MKTKIFKLVLPAFVFMLAIVSAFAFKGIEESALLAPESGWINLPGQPCHLEVECSTDPGPICTTVYNGMEFQAFGKTSEVPLVCSKVLNIRR